VLLGSEISKKFQRRLQVERMAGKRTREDESPKDRSTEESGKEDEDALLNEDEDSLPTQTTVPAASEKSSDTLESTFIKLNDNMLSVTKSKSSDEAKHHINYLEMLAIKLGLKCFEDKIRQRM